MSPPLPPPASARSRLRIWRPSPAAAAEIALRAALPVAMMLAVTLSLALSGERSATAETLFLGLWAAAVFTPLALLDTARRPLHAGLGVATTLLVATLPRLGGLRPAAVGALLALAVLMLAARTLVARSEPSLRSSVALSLAAAFVLYGHRLYVEGLTFSTVFLLGVLPGIAAVVAARLAAGAGPGAGRRATALALTLLIAPQLASEPWWVGLVYATAALSSGFGPEAEAQLAQRGLFLFAAATFLAASFPWLRAAPVATLLGAVATLDRPVAQSPLGDRVVVLTQASPRLDVELSGDAVRSLVVDSYLTHGVDLACGEELAAIELLDESPEATGRRKRAQAPWRDTLVVGRDSAEWAAGRPDVAARLACPAPPPWLSWIPGAGRFLGQTSRARFELPGPRTARRLVLERSPALPAETSLAVFFLATER